MRAACISETYCPYKTDTGYCGYTGTGCAQSLVRSVRIDEPSYMIVQRVEVSDESIEKIAEAVVEKLRYCGAKMENKSPTQYGQREGE